MTLTCNNRAFLARNYSAVTDNNLTTIVLSDHCPSFKQLSFFQTDFMGTKLPLTGSPLCQWLEKPESMADGNMYTYGNEMALLYDVTVDPRLRHPGARGGEKMEDVWGQKERDEYIVMKVMTYCTSSSHTALAYSQC